MSGLEIIGAVAAVGATLAKAKTCYDVVRRFRRAPQDINILLGELSFAKVSLSHAQQHLQSLRPDKAGDAASLDETKEWVTAVSGLVQRVDLVVDEIQVLVERFSEKKNNNKLLVKRARWLIDADAVKAARLTLTSIREELNFALGIASSEHQFETKNELSRLASLAEVIFQHTSQQARIMSAQDDSIRALTQAFEDSAKLQSNAAPRANSNESRRSSDAQEGSDPTTSNPLELWPSNESTSSLGSTTQEFTALRPQRGRMPSDESIDMPVTRHRSVSNTTHDGCSPTCRCACHRSALFTTPQFMKLLVGNGSLTLSGFAATKAACDKSTCSRKSAVWTSRFTYVFPMWFAAKAISMYCRSGPIGEPELKLNTRRVALTEAYRLAQVGDVQGLDILYNSGKASVHDVHPQEGQSALLVAVWCGQANVVRYLLGRNAIKEEQTFEGLETLDAVVRHVYGKVSPPGTTGLLAHLFHLDDVIDEQQWNIIHKIVLGMADSYDLATECSEHPELVNEVDLRKRTPLWWAALRHDVEACRILLENNAKPNTSDYQGETAMQNAAASTQPDIIQLLLDGGADPGADGNVSETPLHYACRSNARVATVKLLLENGSDPNASNINGITPLHEAIEVDAIDVAMLLREHGANFELRDASGDSFVHMAIRCRAARILHLLISEGCDLTACGTSKQNIIHYAAQFGTINTTELLANAKLDGIDGQAKDVLGLDPAAYLEQRTELAKHAGDDVDPDVVSVIRALIAQTSELAKADV